MVQRRRELVRSKSGCWTENLTFTLEEALSRMRNHVVTVVRGIIGRNKGLEVELKNKILVAIVHGFKEINKRKTESTVSHKDAFKKANEKNWRLKPDVFYQNVSKLLCLNGRSRLQWSLRSGSHYPNGEW